jgi:homoserine kinase
VKLTARVPSTSANLGPGFDCFGLALDLCNEVTLDLGAAPGVTWEGEGAQELPTDGSDMVSRAIRSTLERWGARDPRAEIPPFALHGVNRIPLARGLGSSSAAAVAGVALARALLGAVGSADDRPGIFAAAAELEGHPDNAAPAVYGGLTVIAEGLVRRFDVHPAIRPVALVPERLRVPTEAARRALPDRVPLADAVANIAHAALVLAALTSGDLDLLGVALRDRLHEDVRLALVPAARRLVEEVRGAGLPVCVSGSGPTLLAFEREGVPLPDPGEGWRVLRLPVRAVGVEVLRA